MGLTVEINHFLLIEPPDNSKNERLLILHYRVLDGYIVVLMLISCPATATEVASFCNKYHFGIIMDRLILKSRNK